MMYPKLAQLALIFTSIFAAIVSHAEESAHGAEAGAHHAAAIPTSVTYQAINFVIYVGLLLYFLRRPIRDYFVGREATYKQALVKADAAKRAAQEKRQDIEQRLQKLESTSAESLESARAEAAALKLQIKQDAEKIAERLKSEAAKSVEIELEKARQQLRREILDQSLEMSQKLLADKMVEGDQKRLQTEFVEKIQEVR